jgi:hypothetical protein
LGEHNVVGEVFWRKDPVDVREVYVNGRLVCKDGGAVNLDSKRIRRDFKECLAEFWKGQPFQIDSL